MSAPALGFVDPRPLPVSVVRHDDIERIAEHFEKRRLPVARSVYFAVVQLCAEASAMQASATRKDLAAMAGTSSVRTLDEYLTELIAAGLLHKVQRREDGLNLPNIYGLGPAPVGGAADGTTSAGCGSAADGTQQSSSLLPDDEKKEDGRGRTALPPIGDEFDVPFHLVADATELLRRRERVNGRVVTPEEMRLGAIIVAEFNRQAESDFGLGAHLTSIVMRIRERPSYDAGAHVRLVQSAWRIKWWTKRPRKRGGRVTPAVIYGHAAVFENVVQDAMDEKAGKTIEEPRAASAFARTKGSVEDEEI